MSEEMKIEIKLKADDMVKKRIEKLQEHFAKLTELIQKGYLKVEKLEEEIERTHKAIKFARRTKGEVLALISKYRRMGFDLL